MNIKRRKKIKLSVSSFNIINKVWENNFQWIFILLYAKHEVSAHLVDSIIYEYYYICVKLSQRLV